MRNSIKIFSLIFALLFLAVSSFAQSKARLFGRVTDENGDPLPGTAVYVKNDKGGTAAATTTDANGNYDFICPINSVINFQFLGYNEEAVQWDGAQTILNMSLQPSAKTILNESVVIGYGAVKAADLTGSLSTVKMADVRDMPSLNLDDVLQGRIAGMDIVAGDGEPGSSASIRIRGTRSISASNDPLIVLDGVPDAVTDINDINFADVESITVLKDASSTAIYGSRGANGVILVNTIGSSFDKVQQKLKVTANAQVGVSFLSKKLDIMNAQEFTSYMNEYSQYSASSNKGMNTPVSGLSYPDPEARGKGTDWINEVTRPAMYQNYVVSLNGTAGKSRIYSSISYNNEEGIVKRSGKRNFTGTLNISNKVTKWLILGANLKYQYKITDNNVTAIGGTNVYNSAIYLSPTLDVTDSFNPYEGSGTTINNPVEKLKGYFNTTNRSLLNISANAEVILPAELKFKTKFSVFRHDRQWFWYWNSTLPSRQGGEGGEAQRQDFQEMSLNWDNTLTWAPKLKGGNSFDAMLGFNAYTYQNNYFELYGAGYQDDSIQWNNMNAVLDKETYKASTSQANKIKMAAFARLNYNYKKRYYITATGRFDGASNFAQNRKWGFFPSAAFKWVVSNEKFLKRSKVVDNLAVRLSAGSSGNDLNEAYKSLAKMSSSTTGYLFGGSQPVGFYQSSIDSPNLTWERTDNYNVGIDASFFNGRLTAVLEAYIANTSDLLLTVQTAQHTGYNSKYQNVGKTQTRGVELTLSSRNIVRKGFVWSSDLTLSRSTSTVKDIGSNNYITVAQDPNKYMMVGYKNGYPVNSFWGFQYAGVWHSAEEVERNRTTHSYVNPVSNTTLGYSKYVDVNHDGSLDNNDLCYLGSPDPYLYGGFNNTFRIRNLTLSCFLNFALGGKVYNYSEFYMAGSRQTNQYRYMLNAWHQYKNPDSDYPRAGSTGGANVASSFMVHDASYLRIKNVSVAYNIPVKSRGLKEISLILSGENLYVFTTYNGFDPDVSSNSMRKVDYSNYPKSTKVVMAVKLKF